MEVPQDAPTLKRAAPSGRPSFPIPLGNNGKEDRTKTDAAIVEIRKKLRKKHVPTIPHDEVLRKDIDVDFSDFEPAPETDVDLSDINAGIATEVRARRAVAEQMETNDMTIAKAQELIPNAYHLWNHAKLIAAEDPMASLILTSESKNFFMPEAKGRHVTPDQATTYIFTLATYREALMRDDKEKAARYLDKVVKMSEVLGLLPQNEDMKSPEEIDMDISDLMKEEPDTIPETDVDLSDLEREVSSAVQTKRKLPHYDPDFGKDAADDGSTYTATFSKLPRGVKEEHERTMAEMMTQKRAYELVPAHDQFVDLIRDKVGDHPGTSMYLTAEAQRYVPQPKPLEALTFAVANVIAKRERGDIDAANKEEERVRGLAATIGVSGNPLFESSIAHRTYAKGIESVKIRQAHVKQQERRNNPNFAA